MPIYEYRCEDCGHLFEKLVFRGDDETIVCPKCKSEQARKQISAVGFMSGSGLGSCVAPSSGGFS